ncbi:hypothetical protein UPYG_G00181820 [Umbra pygmaea]|uniref:ABC-type oligopeptide transporter ABCB9 n=1 Tax=Umbra pygmaea TaxID=75934 RepID=A0ABD0X9K4_UMBPY
MLSVDSLQVVAEEEVVESSSNRLGDIYTFVAEGCYPQTMNPIRKKNLKRYAQKFIIDEGRLYYVGPKKDEKREVVIEAERKRHIFLECHFNDIGHHLGQKKTVHRIQSKYYWLGIVKDVVDWIKVCETCQHTERNKNMTRTVRPIKVDAPWEILGIDILGPFPESHQGNSSVVIITDYYSKWIEAFPIQKRDALSIARCISTSIYRFGAAKTVISTQSMDFCDEVTKHLCDRWNLVQRVSAVELNPLHDRSSVLLKDSIVRLVAEKEGDWDDFLDPILYFFRTGVNPTTKFTPYSLMFNRKAVLPTETKSRPLNIEQDADLYDSKDEASDCITVMQEQQNSVKQLVIANMNATYKQEKKNAKRRGRNLPSVTFKVTDPLFGSRESPSPKKLKQSIYLSFPVETVLATEQSSSEDKNKCDIDETCLCRIKHKLCIKESSLFTENPSEDKCNDSDNLADTISPIVTKRMGVLRAVSCSFLFILVDVIVTTVIYLHGSQLAIFTDDLQDFDILHSVLDLWGTVLVRSCLLLGASVGILWNRVEGPERVSALGTVILLIGLTISTYALAKLLMLSEQGDLAQQPWFLSLFSWTCMSSLGTVLLFTLLGRSTDSLTNEGGDGGGGGCEETERLVETAGDSCSVEFEDQKGEHREKKGSASREGALKQTNSRATLGRLLAYCSKDAWLLSLAFFFLLISAVCEAFIPYYTGKAIDGIVIHKSMEYFTKPLITLTVLSLASSIAVGVRGGVFTLTIARLNLRLRNLLFRSLMHQEIGFFDANHTGNITSRLTSDTTQVSDLISLNVNLFLRSMVKAIGYFIFMFSMSWKLTLVTIMGFPFIAVISKVYGEYYKKLTKDVQSALAMANQVAEETVSAMKTVRSFANEEHEAESYNKKLLVMFQLNKKQALAYALYMWSSNISALVLIVAVLFYGGHLVVTDQMSGGTLISFIIYELELEECLESISSVYTGLMQGVGAAEKVFEYIDREPKHPMDGKEVPDTCEGLVEFKDVTFSYPTRPNTEILKSVSFTLRPGEVTALVGPSGSGKSSCVGLLENFYPPQQGQVLLDGRPVHTYQHNVLHSRVALVGQEPVLFARSVEQNITYGLTDVPMESVVQAASKANAHDFITSLTNGYDTEVGEKGTQLSGGQKQRVAIARAFIRNPHVLILDEATSALDAESEHVVQEALNSTMHQHTVLVIAHRLSTVEKADNILVIDSGCVVEQGQHSQLMAKGGLYYKLVQRQVLAIETGAEVLNPLEDKHLWKSDGSSQQRGADSHSGSESEFEAPRY